MPFSCRFHQKVWRLMEEDSSKPGYLSPEEKKTWDNAIQGTKKLKKHKPKTEKTLPSPSFHPKLQPQPLFDAQLSASLPHLSPGNMAGVDGSITQQLRRGKYPVDRTLDLHGMTKDMAYQTIARVITTAYGQGQRCLLVVTGKGNILKGGAGVIRESLPSWINTEALRPLVLAYCHAAPHHGGTGAFYLLLRRNKQS